MFPGDAAAGGHHKLREDHGLVRRIGSRKTRESLTRFSWPGNARELRNVVERAMIVSQGPKLEITLPAASGDAADEDTTRLEEIQRLHILKMLERTRWRLRGPAGAAELLDLKPSTLEYRMKKLEIERPS